MTQSSTGVESRAAPALDIAFWEISGKVCKKPVHQMLGGLCRDKQRTYNTCAGYKYVRSNKIRPDANWNMAESEGPFEDRDGFMSRADRPAESLLEEGITAMWFKGFPCGHSDPTLPAAIFNTRLDTFNDKDVRWAIALLVDIKSVD